MSIPGQPFVRNDLKPVPLDKSSLEHVLRTLQEAVGKSVSLLADLSEQILDDHEAHSSRIAHIYTGDSGIALMFLRLTLQYDAAGLDPFLPSTFRLKLPAIISHLLLDPDRELPRLKPGRLSPLDTSSGPALMYVLASLSYPAMDFGHGVMTERHAWHAAIKTLRNARRKASDDESLGGDELLYGRAGLLWALINLRKWLKADTRGVDGYRRKDLIKVIGESVDVLANKILVAGSTGAILYERGHNGTSLPLMWEWHGKNYLGAVHGAAGILTVILQAPQEIVRPHLRSISSCISALCSLVTQSCGNLPSSLPERSKVFHLVQICHGSPGFLLLLATMRAGYPEEWQTEWEEAEAMASDRVWEEGLLRKGLGLCHGISGNAWPLMLLGMMKRGTLHGDTALSQSLAMLVESTRLPPLNNSPKARSIFRTPDHTASLFEGLAGAVTAWLDACVLIRTLLAERTSSSSSSPTDPMEKGIPGVFGVPGIGGTGPHGLL